MVPNEGGRLAAIEKQHWEEGAAGTATKEVENNQDFGTATKEVENNQDFGRL